MGEEGYDIARDMGRVRPSKDKKDATTMPPSKEMRKTQKVNKGPSALELVKKKYGKSVMKVGKKKANEELDLTQVAEAFGGYVIESIEKPKFYTKKTEDEFEKTPAGKKEIKKKTASLTRNMATNKEIEDADKEFKTGDGKNKSPLETRDPETAETLTRDYDPTPT